MTFLITLFMSFAKRRDDVVRWRRTGEAPRKNTSRYNLTFINQAITITASVTLVCYIMYTVSPEVMREFPYRLPLSHHRIRAGRFAEIHPDSSG